MKIDFHIRAFAVFGILFGVLAASPAAAQDTPLRKSDLVRMLSGSTYSAAEVATIVESNCLSFAPTERDISDFQDLGANDAVLAAVRDCGGAASQDAPTAQNPAAPEPDPAPTLTVEPAASTVTAPVDSVAEVRVLVRRGGQPYEGLEVSIGGSGSIEGGAATDRAGTSGPDGWATIAIPTGTRATRYGLVIEASGAALTGSRNLTLVTTPGAPSVLASPVPPLMMTGGPLGLRIAVEDEFGNGVPSLPIAVAGVPDGSVLARATTDAEGRVPIEIPADRLRGVERLVVSYEDGTIGEVDLEFDVQGVTMAFVSGTSQQGTPGEELAEPVIVEVYGTDGDPAPGAQVEFTISNGRPATATRRTGADGRVSLRVTAGPAAGRPMEIRARSGSAERVLSLPILTSGGMVSDAIARGDQRLAAGDAEGAVSAYRRAVDLDPENVDAWISLGHALAEAGQRDDARYAFERALDIDPENEEAQEALGSPALGRAVFGADVWGGKTIKSGRKFGIRHAEVRINPATGWLQIRGMYDDALNLRHPWLKRGRNDLRGYAAAIDLRWGSLRRLTTTFELGRREQSIPELGQNTILLAQDIRLSGGGGVRFGAWVGRWFDRDDYVLFGEVRFPASRSVMVVPFVSYGDNAGSNIRATGRAPETEVRGGLELRIESLDGWGIEPSLAVGGVSSDLSEEFEGSLLDFRTRMWANLGEARIQGFVQYQSPPGSDSFWTFALGLGFAVQAR